MDKKQQTIDTYNKSAQQLADKFDASGARIADIEMACSLVGKKNPKVFEIGCGNGRDAAEFVKHTDDYTGIDISEELIKLAKQKVPSGKFLVGDIESFHLPKNIDIVFASASLIHVNKESLEGIFSRILEALNPSGLFCLSLKYNDSYKEVTKEDQFGTRTYWHYSDKDILELSQGFSLVKNELYDLRGQKWLEMVFRKSF
jgi:SAM-dependent methyltransferase